MRSFCPRFAPFLSCPRSPWQLHLLPFCPCMMMRRASLPAFLLPAPLPVSQTRHRAFHHRNFANARATAVETPLPCLSTTSLTELTRRIRNGETSATELVEASLSRIESVDDRVNAFLTVEADLALARAAQIDASIQAGRQVGPLCGIPVAIKDNLCTKGIRTTAGSAMLDNFRPAYNATVVERMEAAGAIVIGKTNLDEFGMGSSTELSAYGVTRNPCDLQYVAGGSSGGSAAAVAADMVCLALGSDTGGSVRQPAGFCGVTGYKPSYGRWSRYGLLAYASSLDCVGVLGGSVTDLRIVDQVVRGADGKDSTCCAKEGAMVTHDVTVGVVKESMEEGVETQVVERVKEGMSILGNVKQVSLRGLEEAVAAYYVLASSEASANLARYDGVRFGMRQGDKGVKEMYAKSRARLGKEVKKRIMMGTYALSSGYYDAYYLKAQRVRKWVVAELEKVLKEVDVLIMPVSPVKGYKVGQVVQDALQMYRGDIMTIPASLAGLPAVSVPVGGGVGMQIVGRYGEDEMVFKVGEQLQQNTDWHLNRPKL